MMPKLNKTKIMLLISLGFLGGSVLLTTGLGYLIQGDAIKLEEQARELAFQKAEAEEQFETTKILDETDKERQKLREFFVTESGAIDFIAEIEARAAYLGLDFDTLAISPEKTKDTTFDKLVISFSFSGREEQALNMLKLLESLPYHSYVGDVSVRYSSSDEWAVNTSIEVTIIEK